MVFVSAVSLFRNNMMNRSSSQVSCQNNGLNKAVLQHDIFVKSSQPVFKSTSAGRPLKRLKNIHDPIYDVIMLNEEEWSAIESHINKTTKAADLIKYLKKFTKNMLPVEKKIFTRLSNAIKNNPDLTFQDCMKLWFDEALTKLKLEQFQVLDDIEALSTSLSPKTMLEVRKTTTHCGEVILADDPMSPFKRKTVLASLNSIKPMKGEKIKLKELKEHAEYLPTSGTSENAFIVKYSRRGQNEIAKRILRMSVQTIDHDYPDTLGGENALYNFTLMSGLANSQKSDTLLHKFVERFPLAKKNYQLNMDDIIDVINSRKGMIGHETYPYVHARWLKKQSNGQINLDLSRCRFSEKEAKKMEENRLNELRKRYKTDEI